MMVVRRWLWWVYGSGEVCEEEGEKIGGLWLWWVYGSGENRQRMMRNRWLREENPVRLYEIDEGDDKSEGLDGR